MPIPGDMTDEEKQAFLAQLRGETTEADAPGYLERLRQFLPGATTLGGAATGAMYGGRLLAPYGPWAGAAGAIGGAIYGGAAGRYGGDVAVAGSQGRLPADPWASVGRGALEGAEMEMFGQGVGGLVAGGFAAKQAITQKYGGAVKTFIASLRDWLTGAGSKAQEFVQTMGELPVPIPYAPSEAKASATMARLERYPANTWTGVGSEQRLNEAQRQATLANARAIAEKVGPPVPTGEAGANISATAQSILDARRAAEDVSLLAQRRGYEQQLRAKGPTIGPAATPAEVGTEVATTLRARERVVRQEAEQLKEALLPAAESVEGVASNTQAAIKAVEHERKALGRLVGPRAGRAAEQVRDALPKDPVGEAIQALREVGAKIPPGTTVGGKPIPEGPPAFLATDAIELERGLTMAKGQSGLSDAERRWFKQLRQGVRDDLDEMIQASDQPELKRQWEEWKAYYRKEVGEPFGEKSWGRKLEDMVVPEDVVNAVRNYAPSELRAFKKQVMAQNPETFSRVARADFEQLVKGSLDPATGEFVPGRLAQQLFRRDPEVLAELYGVHVDEMRRLAQASANALVSNPTMAARAEMEVLRALAKRAPEKVVPSLIRVYGQRGVDLILPVIPAEKRPEIVRAIFDEMVESSFRGGLQEFSRKTFLGQLSKNELLLENLIKPNHPEAWTDIQRLRRVMQQQLEIRPWADNPSQTGQSLISANMIRQIGERSLGTAASFATLNMLAGVEGTTAIAMTAGLPWVLGKLLVDPATARAAREFVELTPGTVEWARMAGRLIQRLSASDPEGGPIQ